MHYILLQWHTILTCKNNWETILIQTSIFGHYFLEYEQSEHTSSLPLENSRFPAKKMEFLETYIHHCEPDNIPILKDFFDELDDYITKSNFFILCNELYEHMGNLYKLVNQYFSNDQCMIFQKNAWVKDSSKCKPSQWILLYIIYIIYIIYIT